MHLIIRGRFKKNLQFFRGIFRPNLHRLKPLSRICGLDRGRPVDRYYIENFLTKHARSIQGCVLEFEDSRYTTRFGENRVTKSDVLNLSEGNPQATIVGDLTQNLAIPDNTFDCIILTQTLHLIYDLRTALKALRRILRPKGVLLATLPGISQICRDPKNIWHDSWRFTHSSTRRLFEEFFPKENVEIESYGNVLVSSAFLYGLATEELRPEELDYRDNDYDFLIAVKAIKPEM
jgi:SAM-dependent methyltransferase